MKARVVGAIGPILGGRKKATNLQANAIIAMCLAFACELLQSGAANSCDLAMALDSWPDAQVLSEPLSFKTPSGSVLRVSRAGVNQVAGSAECVASVKIDDDPSRYDRVKFLHKSESLSKADVFASKTDYKIEKAENRLMHLDREYYKKLATNEIKWNCSPARIMISDDIGGASHGATFYLYRRPDGSFEERQMQMCAP